MIGHVALDGNLARAVIAFFAILDPLGNVLVFYLLTQSLEPARRLYVAALAVLAAWALLVLFSLGGQQVLDFLGISAESFRVAAGLLLLLLAYQMVARGQPLEAEAEKSLEPVQIALVPLATPLLAGPGALATAISLSGTLGLGMTILGLSLVLAGSFGVFAGATWCFRCLGPSVLRLLTRLVGILLFAIAVDFVLKGFRAIFWFG